MDSTCLGAGLSRQRIIGPPKPDMARCGFSHFQHCDLARVRVTKETDNIFQQFKFPVNRMLPLVLGDHSKVSLELVVKGPGNCKLPHSNDQCIMLRFSTRICSHNAEVIDTNVFLQWKRDYLLVFSLEMSPPKIIDRNSSVTINNPQPEIPGVTILKVLESICRNNYPERSNLIRKLINDGMIHFYRELILFISPSTLQHFTNPLVIMPGARWPSINLRS